MNELLSAVKTAVTQTLNSLKLPNVYIGTVTGVNPLRVTIGQKLELSSNQLVLSRNVIDYKVLMTVAHETETASILIPEQATAHSHAINGRETENTNFNSSHNHDVTLDITNIKTQPSEINTTHKHSVPSTETEIGGFTINATGHMHSYSGKKEYLVHNALSVGETVILVNITGGQRFFILDRVGG